MQRPHTAHCPSQWPAAPPIDLDWGGGVLRQTGHSGSTQHLVAPLRTSSALSVEEEVGVWLGSLGITQEGTDWRAERGQCPGLPLTLSPSSHLEAEVAPRCEITFKLRKFLEPVKTPVCL